MPKTPIKKLNGNFNMKLIRPSYEIIEQGPGLQGIYDIIEKCGKTSYKSEPKGGEVARKFVEARTKERHGAVLEFGTVYFRVPFDAFPNDEVCFSGYFKFVDFYNKNKYSVVKYGDDKLDDIGKPLPIQDAYITTNYRVLVENNRLDDLKYLCEPTEYHEKRYAVKFITDIGVGREFLRHRTMSMVQESTRYVNYMKEKFGGECTFVIPSWIPKDELAEGEHVHWWDGDWVNLNNMKIVKYGKDLPTPGFPTNDPVNTWLESLLQCEMTYKILINQGWQAQQARTVLPLSTKTEFVLCGFKDAWVHFFRLRSDIAATGKPQPQSEELATPLREGFIERGYITKKSLEHEAFGDFDVAISDSNIEP